MRCGKKETSNAQYGCHLEHGHDGRHQARARCPAISTEWSDPRPGDKRCLFCDGGQAHPAVCPTEYFRASSGWSKDQRDGRPWVMRPGDDVTRTDIYTVRLVREMSDDGRIWEYDRPRDGIFKYTQIDRRRQSQEGK